jgi:hypothetical protein
MTTLIPKFDLMNGGSTPTGAVNRPINQKLQEFVSVLDFGADSTGVTDSSTAFTNAIATGKAVFVPKGTYQASFNLNSLNVIYGESGRGVSVLIPPTGATYVIQIDVTTTSKVNCIIKDLEISNPNSIANCTAINFKGTNVSTINDEHIVENIYINNLAIGINVTGRLITSSFRNIQVYGGNVGMQVSTDTSSAAFIENTFNLVQFYNQQNQAVLMNGILINNRFESCVFQGANQASVGNVPAVSITSAQSERMQFVNCYFENNGSSIPVDTINLYNNSFGLSFSGAVCIEPLIDSCWMVGSGVLLFIQNTTGLVGGEVTNTRFAPTANGWDIYINSNPNPVRFAVDGNNYFSGVTFINTWTGGFGQAAYIKQIDTCQYLSGASTVDLRVAKKVIYSNLSENITLNGTVVTNRIPGEEFWVYNQSPTYSVTIDSSITDTGSNITLAPGTKAIFMVCDYPYDRKLTRMV